MFPNTGLRATNLHRNRALRGQAARSSGESGAGLDLALSQNPPLHLPLGAAAYKRMQSKLDQWREEMAKYEAVSLGADFPEGQ